MKRLSLLALLLIATATRADSLRDEILRADAAMFDAYNAHDAAKLMSWFSKDLEFYHDKDGLVTYDQVSKGLTNLLSRNDGLRRDLIKDSVEVYPIKGYGAIEIGSHRFCHVENGKDDCGTFKFVHVWKNENGSWRVTRVVSVDHR